MVLRHTLRHTTFAAPRLQCLMATTRLDSLYTHHHRAHHRADTITDAQLKTTRIRRVGLRISTRSTNIPALATQRTSANPIM